ncbi:MAG: alanine--tRNA ligase [Saprospirales bacterium]|nr:alanine--tRNA ligase [Saprospirales bacterium]
MTAQEIRQRFLDFFESKGHKIVASSPIVSKNDPTLLFTNAGMNQFKDFFLGNKVPEFRRIADTQKCLRVSGKHNDLEEVGRDGYHHTMFEMLGNWSFGNYFKAEAIAWAWELLTKEYGLDPDRIYVSVFQGDESENLAPDDEARELWKKWLPEDRILPFSKKDNFWEMGDTGPCGPCSEIHVDLRPESQRSSRDARELVNIGDPLVVEIWNLVFIQFNRRADGKLEELPEKHVDTGMGFERLTMALQAKNSSYETDIFQPYIRFIEQVSGKKYTNSYAPDAMSDIAMRVLCDHIRAVSFAIADGQLPSNTGAGYVIRRILRRAVRYYYSFLDLREPFLFRLIPLLADAFAHVFPELKAQTGLVASVIQGEEQSFLHTLENGLRRMESIQAPKGVISGADVFELYDTYGFPKDLTQLIAEEKGLRIDEAGFDEALQAQKKRSRADAQKQVGDWIPVGNGESNEFVGYDQLEVSNARILKYRIVHTKQADQYQIVLDVTPFYAQSGGQAGDTGTLKVGDDWLKVLDTVKENDLIIHIVDQLPDKPEAPVIASVEKTRRKATAQNHSATHLMHAALHRVLGNHALQKGQDVDSDRLRFDFSHFQKVTDEEIARIETMVNEKIRENIQLEEDRHVDIESARKLGAMMLFGEKYGDQVRVITFDANFSRELCGGTHVPATGEIGLFKILSESAVAAGIRRIEAVTADKAQADIERELEELNEIRALFKTSLNPAKNVASMLEENKALKKEIERLLAAQAGGLKNELKAKVQKLGELNFLSAIVPLGDANALKNLVYQLESEIGNIVIVLGAVSQDKPQLLVAVSKELTESKGLHAGNMVRELAKHIQGGGGGQPFFATAGGKDVGGLEKAVGAAKQVLEDATQP